MKKNMLKYVQDYLNYRRALGYRLIVDERHLRAFCRFASKHGYRGSLKRSWVDEFVYEPKDVKPAYYTVRFRILRDFAKYWSNYDEHVEVPYSNPGYKGYSRIEPHIYTDEETQILMAAARHAHVDQGIPGETYATIIGLMACSGIRTGEAASLLKSDVDWDHNLLHIRQSKGRPMRLVPLHGTAMAALDSYAELRDQYFAGSKNDHFFLNKYGNTLTGRAIHETFYHIRFRSGIVISLRNRVPRLYDFRHTFACNCLIRWLREGVDMSRSIHNLATYLGHESLDETYWYFSGVPELLELVGERFASCAARVFEQGVQS
jgi:integrase